MREGDLVENFALPDQDGVERTLEELLSDGPIALYFFPAAMTPGCTAESCSFRDRSEEFADVGARRVGISRDSSAKLREFADRDHLDFTLLSDEAGVVSDIFGVRRNFKLIPTKRQTFVIGTDRRLVGTVKSEIRMSHHAEGALGLLRDHQGSH